MLYVPRQPANPRFSCPTSPNWRVSHDCAAVAQGHPENKNMDFWENTTCGGSGLDSADWVFRESAKYYWTRKIGILDMDILEANIEARRQKRATITNKLADGSTKVSTIYEDGRELTATYTAEQTIKPIAPIKLAHHHALSDEEKLALHKMLQYDKATATIPNAFISLAFNQKNIDLEYATKQLKLFYKRMQEITFGQTWESAVLKQRNSNSLETRRNVLGAPAHFVMENVDSNLHWHGVMFLTKQHYSRLKLKAKKRMDGEGAPILHERLAQVWQSMNPAGTMTLRRIAADTLSRDTYYIIKRLNTLSDYESKYVVAPHFDR
jgi:hypothetical protein